MAVRQLMIQVRPFVESEMFAGKLELILIGASSGEPMERTGSARIGFESGIEGDRYPRKPGGDPGRQLTLIEAEALEAVGREYDFSLTADEARRNLVTRDVPLNHLVDKEFLVGDVRLRGVRLCEPCKKLENMTGKKVLDALAHRGGLRAEVVEGGTIHVGDAIVIS